MECNGLTCRCGATDKWYLIWAYTDIYSLTLNCKACGAVYTIAENEKEFVNVYELIRGSNNAK